MLSTFLAFAAGSATAASPCILPMLPLLLGAALPPTGGNVRPGRHRPAFIVAGFVLSFALATWLFGASARVLGVSPEAVRSAGIAVMLVCGVLLLWPALMGKAMSPLAPLADWGHRLGARAGSGHAGGLLLGASLGLLWTPCAGPVLASVLALIATQQAPGEAAGLLLAYAAGAGLPMLLVAYGSEAVVTRVRGVARHAGAIRGVFGILMVATAAAMHAQLDVAAVAAASRWWGQVSSAASLPTVEHRADPHANPRVDQAEAQAPEFTGSGPWINSPPLTLRGLRGRVVLVDFWTHGCINCVNTLPHLQRWHERYRHRGLVVVGVHTPEFAVERELANVQAAVRRFGLGYPVVLDNAYGTWGAWRVRAWPTLYLVDRQGRVVFRHEGEGDYDEIERQIESAL